jgi:hypothetical protein
VELQAGAIFRVVASGHPLLAACAAAGHLVVIRSIDEASDYAHITVRGSEGRARATAALPMRVLATSLLVTEPRDGNDDGTPLSA